MHVTTDWSVWPKSESEESDKKKPNQFSPYTPKQMSQKSINIFHCFANKNEQNTGYLDALLKCQRILKYWIDGGQSKKEKKKL